MLNMRCWLFFIFIMQVQSIFNSNAAIQNQMAKSFEHNRKEFKRKLNMDINLHNEVNGDIKQFLRVYTRSEVLGCAEGRVEGDVKKMGNRLRNRTRLNDVIFGMEHTTAELLRIYKYRLSSTQHMVRLVCFGKWHKNISDDIHQNNNQLLVIHCAANTISLNGWMDLLRNQTYFK
eukprot:663725_1